MPRFALILLLGFAALPKAGSVQLPRLVPDGTFFRLETGERFTWIGASDFDLYDQFLAGMDVAPVLRQRAEAGFNAVRVFTAFDICASGEGCQKIGRLVPREHADFYTRLAPFARLLARHGLYVELVAFTGPYARVFPGEESGNDEAKVEHWNRLIDAVADSSNVLLELVNEFDNGPNVGLPFERLRRPPAPICASRGSNAGGGDGLPVAPGWCYATYHAGPSAEEHWPMVTAYDGMANVAERWRVPVIVNESIRFPDNEDNADRAFDAAQGCALLQAGCVFHSVSGKSSVLWSEAELRNARAWAAGARSVPLEFQSGSFRRREDLEDAAHVRVYSRVLPDGREFINRIRR
jgi:hypothetical protein